MLEAGELELVDSDGELMVRYFEHEVPIAPGSLDQLPGAGSPERINAEPALLHLLLENQHYRLSFWRTDMELITDGSSTSTSSWPFEWKNPRCLITFTRWHSGWSLDGLRIDHVDGLKNPSKYLHDLRERALGPT